MKRLMKFVADNYAGGEFAHEIHTKDSVGDTLFTFLMREAHDAGSHTEFDNMLDTAERQISALRESMA
jgi:hypothetical protein